MNGTTTPPDNNVGIDLPDYVSGKYDIQPINGSNRRPGMDTEHHWLVRYNFHPSAGWGCCATFVTKLEAVQFVNEKFPCQESVAVQNETDYDKLEKAATRAYAHAIQTCANVWNYLYMKHDKARGATVRLEKAVDAARELAAHDGNGRLVIVIGTPWQAVDAVLEMAGSLPAGKRRGVAAAYRATDAAFKSLVAFNQCANGTSIYQSRINDTKGMK